MIDRQDVKDFWDAVWPFVPPSIGAYFGLKHSIERSRKEATITWFCAAFISLFLGQAVGEYWDLKRAATSGVSIIIAMFLSDLVAVVMSILRQWVNDPAGAFRRWRNAWMGRTGGDA